MPTTLVMLTIRPQRRLIIPRAACLVIRKAPFRFVSSTVLQSSSLIRNNRLSRVVPALFTRMSILPNSRSTVPTVVSTCRAFARGLRGAGLCVRRRLLGLGAVPGQHRHLGTGAREGLRDRVTDAAAAPGDDPHLAGEIGRASCRER